MRITYRLMAMASTAGALSLIGTVAHAAGSGYAPTTSPVPSGTPGGFTQVVTAVEPFPLCG